MGRTLAWGLWGGGLLAVITSSVIIVAAPDIAKQNVGMVVGGYALGALTTLAGVVLQGIRCHQKAA